MNTSDKITKSWWVILSFIMGINGFGFIYIGSKYSNRNWIVEGVIYEIPWFFYILYSLFYLRHSINPATIAVQFAQLLMFISIIRSFWVAIKLCDVYDNYEKYAINPTELNNKSNATENDKLSSKATCCLCIAAIFFLFAIISIF
jgi:hypothetical protein